MALNASVLTTYATSIIVNGKIGMREALLGTISGGILYGSIANVNGNIGAAIAIGTLAGIISALWYRFVFPSINGLNTIRDSMGMFGLGIISFLGTFFVAPIVIIALYNNQPPLLNIEVVSNPNSAGWVLSYVGISAAIGFVGGLIAYLFSLLGRGEANGKEYED